MILACLPVMDPSTSASLLPDSLDGWSSWGCAARVLRVVHVRATHECRLVVSGVARIYAKQVCAPHSDTGTVDAASIASVRPFRDPANLPPASQDTSTSLTRMKRAAEKLMSCLRAPSVSPSLPLSLIHI